LKYVNLTIRIHIVNGYNYVFLGAKIATNTWSNSFKLEIITHQYCTPVNFWSQKKASRFLWKSFVPLLGTMSNKILLEDIDICLDMG